MYSCCLAALSQPTPMERTFGKQLGRAVGVGEPLKHEELEWGNSGGTAGAAAILVQEPWLSRRVAMENILLSFPKSFEGSKMPICGQLAPASLWKSIFLATAIGDLKPPRMGSALLMGSLCSSMGFSTEVLGTWNLQEGLFLNPPHLRDFCFSLGVSQRIPPSLAAASPAARLYLCVHHWRAPGLLQENTWSQERGRR